jgi:glycosyltransferase involved in cell wall biosynthesis
LDARIAELGLGASVHWAGYVSYGSMWEYLRTSDIFVLPTLSEGTPHVLVEARANSLPVVASRVGGVPTSVTDGHDGLLVPPRDAGAIAEAVGRIISDGDLRRKLIRNGLLSAREMTVDRFADTIRHYLSEADLEREP